MREPEKSTSLASDSVKVDPDPPLRVFDSSPVPKPASEPAAGGTSRAVRDALIGLALSAVALNGFLYYIGWVRRHEFYSELGLATGALELSSPGTILQNTSLLGDVIFLCFALAAWCAVAWLLAGFVPDKIGIVKQNRERVLTGIAVTCLLLGSVFLLPRQDVTASVLLLTGTLVGTRSRLLADVARAGLGATGARLFAVVAAVLLGVWFLSGWVAAEAAREAQAVLANDRAGMARVRIVATEDLGLPGAGFSATSRPVWQYQWVDYRYLSKAKDGFLLIPDGYNQVVLVQPSENVRIEFDPAK